MGTIMKKTAFAAVAASVTAITIASLAWACTATSSITLASDVIPPGRRVAISAETIPPGAAEVRWNSLDGPLLASAIVPEDSNSLQIEFSAPEVSPGVYHVLLIPSNKVVARAAIQITNGDSSEVRLTSSDLWNGFSQGGSSEVAEAAASATYPYGAGRMAGLGIFAFGVVAMAGSVGLVAAGRRSRAPK